MLEDDITAQPLFGVFSNETVDEANCIFGEMLGVIDLCVFNLG